MSTQTKVLLGLGVIGLAAGTLVSTNAIKPPIASASYVLLPVGAIFFGLFLVSRILERESGYFDQEHDAAVKTAERKTEAGKAPSSPAAHSPR